MTSASHAEGRQLDPGQVYFDLWHQPTASHLQLFLWHSKNNAFQPLHYTAHGCAVCHTAHHFATLFRLLQLTWAPRAALRRARQTGACRMQLRIDGAELKFRTGVGVMHWCGKEYVLLNIGVATS